MRSGSRKLHDVRLSVIGSKDSKCSCRGVLHGADLESRTLPGTVLQEECWTGCAGPQLRRSDRNAAGRACIARGGCEDGGVGGGVNGAG